MYEDGDEDKELVIRRKKERMSKEQVKIQKDRKTERHKDINVKKDGT